MDTPTEMDRLWASVAEAEQASRRGTELLAELRRLLVRGDALSTTWMEDRRKVRELIEAHRAAVGEVKARLHEARLRSYTGVTPAECEKETSETVPHSSIKAVG